MVVLLTARPDWQAVGGAAEAYGLVAAGSGVYSVNFANLALTATGGYGGYGGAAQTFQADTNNSQGDMYMSTDGADGGSAASVGLTIQNGSMQLTAEAISSTAAGGTAGGAGRDNNANTVNGAAPPMRGRVAKPLQQASQFKASCRMSWR